MIAFVFAIIMNFSSYWFSDKIVLMTYGAKQIVRALTRADWPAGSRLKPTPAQAGELRQFLHGFLIFHLGRLPKGRATALANEV